MTSLHDAEPPDSEDEGFWNRGLAHAFRKPAEEPEDDGPSIESTGYCGRYKLGAEIARGGIGIVFRALDEALQREVAVKVLRKTLARNDGMIRRFLKEAQICSNLQHPGIVPVYEMGMALGDRPYFSMKLIEGRTLSAVLAERVEKHAEVRSIAIFEHVCQTLAFAHDRRVIHRDVKPGNVMVGAFGEVQLVDWGFAKPLDGLPERPNYGGQRFEPLAGGSSIAGAVLGTPGYMAPEQARGAIDEIDERADVYALGAMLSELLTGARPRTERESASVAEAVDAAGEEKRARLRRSEADPELVELALWCLAPDPDDRPANAGIVATAVSAYLAGIEQRQLDAAVEAAEARGRAEEERRSHRLAMAVSYLILVAVILGAGILWGVDAARRQELERRDRSARFAIAEASAHLARSDLRNADAAIERARALTSSETDRDVQAELRRVERMYASARSSADARAADLERDRRLMHELRSIRGYPCETAEDHARAIEAYQGAFAATVAHDLDRLSTVEHASVSPALREVLIPALDDLLARAEQVEPPPDELIAKTRRALRLIDPDATRNAVRATPPARLQTDPSFEEAPPLTALAVSLRLRSTHPLAAEIVAISASEAHLSHRGLHDLCVWHLMRGLSADSLRTPESRHRMERALRHATASAAIEEDLASLTALRDVMTAVRPDQVKRVEDRIARLRNP